MRQERTDHSRLSSNDSQAVEDLVPGAAEVMVGGCRYGDGHWRRQPWKKHRLIVIDPPHYKQKTKLRTKEQVLLLGWRYKAPNAFRQLKDQPPDHILPQEPDRLLQPLLPCTARLPAFGRCLRS